MSKLIYNNLFKKLMDVEMRNFKLMDKAKVSKMNSVKDGENVINDVLLRICYILQCDISEIAECVSIEDGGNTGV